MNPSDPNSALEVGRDNEPHLCGLEMLERDVKLEDCRGGVSGVEEGVELLAGSALLEPWRVLEVSSSGKVSSCKGSEVACA